MVYMADTDETKTISGLGRWPKKTSIDSFDNDIPKGIDRTIVPSAPDAWLTALSEYGTMSLQQVLQPALELAQDGFPISNTAASLLQKLSAAVDKDAPEWKSTFDLFAPEGKILEEGEILKQPDLARTFKRLIEAEQGAENKGRKEAITAARDLFYKGDIAKEIVDYSDSLGGLLSLSDMAEFHVEIENPTTAYYKDYEILTCGPWSQGPVTAQVLQILENDDISAIPQNTPDYIHLLSQAFNLAFADRHEFYGDPDFIEVPIAGLLSKEYTKAQRNRISMQNAFTEMPDPGNPWIYEGKNGQNTLKHPDINRDRLEQDTSYTCVVDKWGNSFSATPSDAVFGSPIVPNLGLMISSRGTQSWLDPNHPSSVAPWKRPRLTPNPAMAFKNGRLFMPFGTPGGDAQCPAMVQTFLNVVEFGMNPQAAIEAPRFVPWNFPNSFWPHAYHPGLIHLEGRISREVGQNLSTRGHTVEFIDDWSPSTGAMSCILVDQQNGSLSAGADPRRDAYAIGR
ncbi:MAG: gamma-glutamyltransferase, partial [Chloroflexota bacterium]|nr:gamma-glutamyltransferase [Chloroflexota bacterium]